MQNDIQEGYEIYKKVILQAKHVGKGCLEPYASKCLITLYRVINIFGRYRSAVAPTIPYAIKSQNQDKKKIS